MKKRVPEHILVTCNRCKETTREGEMTDHGITVSDFTTVQLCPRDTPIDLCRECMAALRSWLEGAQ